MSGIHAYGNHLLKMGDGASPEVFATIAGIRSVNGVKTEQTFQESTTFEDYAANDGYQSYSPGPKNPGTVDLELYFDPNATTYEDLLDAHDNQTLINFKQELMNGSQKRTREYSAYVASVGEKFDVNGFLECSISLRVSGGVVRS